MANSRKIVQIFLASPGDLQNERQTAKAVVDAFNKRWADWFDIQIELVGWEDTFKRFGRPQAQINLDLDRCEAFVGMLSRKWGTPPGGSYTSGFEEEFERAFESRKKSARPEMALFFKKIDDEFLKDQGPDLKKVIAFRQRVIDDQQLLFHDFDTIKDFEEKLTDWLTHYVKHLKKREQAISATDERAISSGNSSENAETKGVVHTLLSTAGIQFIREFISDVERDRDSNPAFATDVARFRLLAMMAGVSGNDEHSLGTHDANLMFAQRDAVSLSHREMLGLLRCGLDNISNETVPLWHWYTATNAQDEGRLSLATLIGSQTERIGALVAMRLIGEPIKPLPPLGTDETTGLPRNEFIKSWLSPVANERVRTAALQYLASWGETDDLAIVRAEYNKRNYQTVAAAADTIIRINLRQSREKALQSLIELQPENVDVGLIEAIFAKPASLDTKLLLEGATHRDGKVRSHIVTMLVTRNALPSELAEKLLEDSEATVRLEAVRWIEQNGAEFPEDKAKAIIVKPTRFSGGIGGILGYPPQQSDKEGEALWNRFLKAKMRSLPATTLDESGVPQLLRDEKARFALDFKLFGQRAKALRAGIDNQFQEEFERGVAELERLGVNAEAINKLRSVEDFTRKKWLRFGADVLCEKGEADDLIRIRDILSDGSIPFSRLDIDYLGEHGEWQDIGLLISLADRPDSSGSLFGGLFDDNKVQAIAEAIYRIGKGRFIDLCKQKVPPRLLRQIISCATDNDIVEATESDLIELFQSETVDVRKEILLKSVKSLPKRRLKRLLETHIAQPRLRYYNVTYWLDLGISLSRKQVRHVLEISNRKRQ